MLLQSEDIRDRLLRLGGNQLSVTTRAFDEVGAKVSRYLLLTSLINGIYGVCIGVTLTLLGLPNGLLWGVLAALLRFIPYIGPWIAAVFPITIALAIFPGWTIPILTVALILGLDLISAYVVEPWLYGAGTGVSSGALLVAAVFWTWLWGAPGLFLATPLTVCLAVIGKYFPPLNFLAVLLGDGPVLRPEAKLYQRLLAMDQEDASGILLAQLKEKTLVEVYDETLIPALVLAERDRRNGSVDTQTQLFVIQAIREIVEEAGDWRRDLTRSEKRAEKEGEVIPPPPPRPAVQALCVAADDEADHVVALMAAQVLRQIGFDADVVELATLTGQLGQIVEQKGAQIVVISDVPPSGFAHVRYICKRLAMKSPEMPIIVGVWGSTLDAEKAHDRLPESHVPLFREVAAGDRRLRPTTSRRAPPPVQRGRREPRPIRETTSSPGVPRPMNGRFPLSEPGRRAGAGAARHFVDERPFRARDPEHRGARSSRAGPGGPVHARPASQGAARGGSSRVSTTTRASSTTCTRPWRPTLGNGQSRSARRRSGSSTTTTSIEAEIVDIRRNLPRRYFRELPEARLARLRRRRRASTRWRSISSGTATPSLNLNRLTRFVASFQTVAPLTIGELWAWPVMLKIGLVENLRRHRGRDPGRPERPRRGRALRSRGRERAAGRRAARAPGGARRARSSVQLIQRMREWGPQHAPLRDRGSKSASPRRASRSRTPYAPSTSISRRPRSRSRTRSRASGSAAALDWSRFFERVSVVEEILRSDPAAVYARMDFKSRDRYRHAIEELAQPTAEAQRERRAPLHRERAPGRPSRTPTIRGAPTSATT